MTAEERFDRMENAIRDLIVVSRTVLSSIQEQRELNEAHLKVHDRIDAEIDKLREAQAESRENLHTLNEKLNILIDTVDRIIRNRNGKQE